MLAILAGIVVITTSISKLIGGNSQTLTEYAQENGLQSSSSKVVDNSGSGLTPDIILTPEATDSPQITSDPSTEALGETDCSLPTATPETGNSASTNGEPTAAPTEAPVQLVGASLNGSSQINARIELADGFYSEPLSDNLRRYMTGVSYPANEGENAVTNPAITFDELRYVHIYHYNFEGSVSEGELICNEYIAQDLLEIFYELYRNEYQIAKVLLIDEYNGDDEASMNDNNTSCFNYRVVSGSSSLSKHALGLAIDINPLYNPYITYNKDGTENVAPTAAYAYADRSAGFPYKIDENDLCYKLFTEHGFIWGGNWNSVKDYQHFQKTKP